MGARERGSVSVLAAIWIIVAAVGMLGLLRVGDAAIDAGRAATAADAAALAGAAADGGAAQRAAAANDAVLISIDRTGERVQVRVRVDDAVAEAAAVRYRVE